MPVHKTGNLARFKAKVSENMRSRAAARSKFVGTKKPIHGKPTITRPPTSKKPFPTKQIPTRPIKHPIPTRPIGTKPTFTRPPTGGSITKRPTPPTFKPTPEQRKKLNLPKKLISKSLG